MESTSKKSFFPSAKFVFSFSRGMKLKKNTFEIKVTSSPVISFDAFLSTFFDGFDILENRIDSFQDSSFDGFELTHSHRTDGAVVLQIIRSFLRLKWINVTFYAESFSNLFNEWKIATKLVIFIKLLFFLLFSMMYFSSSVLIFPLSSCPCFAHPLFNLSSLLFL